MFHQVPSLRAQGWISLHCDTYSHSWWTNQQWVKITTPQSYPALVMLETLGMSNSSLGGRHALTWLEIWSLKGCHSSTCLEIFQSKGPRRSTCLDLPRDPILRGPTCLDLPGDLISRRLSLLSLPGDLHPDQGMPGSQAATLLGRISFRKTHS